MSQLLRETNLAQQIYLMKTYRILPSGYNSLDDFHPLEQNALFLADCLQFDVEDSKRTIAIKSKIEVLSATPDLESTDSGLSPGYGTGSQAGSQVDRDMSELKSGRFAGIFEGRAESLKKLKDQYKKSFS